MQKSRLGKLEKEAGTNRTSVNECSVCKSDLSFLNGSNNEYVPSNPAGDRIRKVVRWHNSIASPIFTKFRRTVPTSSVPS